MRGEVRVRGGWPRARRMCAGSRAGSEQAAGNPRAEPLAPLHFKAVVADPAGIPSGSEDWDKTEFPLPNALD